MPRRFLSILFLCGLALPALAQIPEAGTNADFSAVSKAVIQLLQSRDTARFATELTPAIEDWQAILSTNAAKSDPDALAGFRQSAPHLRQRMEEGAKQLLARADSLHVDFSKGGLHAQLIPPRHLRTRRYPRLMAENESLPSAEKLEIILVRDSDTNNPAAAEFKLAMHDLVKFPGGWRTLQGIQWVSFPSNVADAKTVREMALLTKVAAHEAITGVDDPALLKLGEALVHFIRERDLEVFKKEALINTDLVWNAFQQSGLQGPTRKELDDRVNDELQQQSVIARALVQQMQDEGINLKSADIQIKDASVERVQSGGGQPGSLVGLMGSQFKLTLAVKTGVKSKNGTPLSGTYVLGVKQIMRFADDWKVSDEVHWAQLPEGILDSNAASKVEYENYVAKNGTLPTRTDAPEIEFTTLAGEKKMKLSDLRGKVVVLDFWATWCGPCQEPMAQLQTLRNTHPGWQDKVAIVPLSIDDSMKIVRDHVDKRGWTNTFNVWAEEGGWQSKPAAAFRVRGVPTTYIIDAKGQIIHAGHPAGMDIGEIVDTLLK